MHTVLARDLMPCTPHERRWMRGPALELLFPQLHLVALLIVEESAFAGTPSCPGLEPSEHLAVSRTVPRVFSA